MADERLVYACMAICGEIMFNFNAICIEVLDDVVIFQTLIRISKLEKTKKIFFEKMQLAMFSHQKFIFGGPFAALMKDMIERQKNDQKTDGQTRENTLKNTRKIRKTTKGFMVNRKSGRRWIASRNSFIAYSSYRVEINYDEEVLQ